jgi:hypothetical protein
VTIPIYDVKPAVSFFPGFGGIVLRFTYVLARVVGFVVLAVSAITTGVHETRIRAIEANRARYGALEQRIAWDKSTSLEPSHQESGVIPTRVVMESDTRQRDRADTLNDQRVAELELGQHSSKAEQEKYFKLASLHSIDDLGIAIGLVLLVAGLKKELCELPEGLENL